MKKERLAIVSSYDELCGNASYTAALVEGLSHHFDVSVISLNVKLLRTGSSQAARLHIREVCEQLQHFDCVNIQYEAGLFGASIKSMKKNFFSVAKSCKRLVLTMHRYSTKEKYPTLSFFVKNLLEGRLSALRQAFVTAISNNRHIPLYNSVIRFCKKTSTPIIVHTPRDRTLINIAFNYFNVFDHPLSFYTQEYLERIKKTYTRDYFCEKFKLDTSKTYIGIFGFINAYKGHETIIRAMSFLPENYELLILGAQHPHTIRTNEPIDVYIKKLIELIKTLGITKRVKFHRPINDEDFLIAMLGCDYNVLPYLEVHQGGSAVAALSLETKSKSIFSQNHAFFQLERYALNSFKMFSIGNYLELAQAILSYRIENYESALDNYNKKYNIQTSTALYRKLLCRQHQQEAETADLSLCSSTS